MSAAPPDAPRPAPNRGPRYLVLLAITVVVAGALGMIASFAIAALLSFLPSVVGFLFGAVLAFGLPVFLAVRASLALQRRQVHTLVRRLVVLFLILATQVAVLGSVLTFTDRGTGDLAAAGAGVLHTFGGVPVLSGLLEEHARREHVPLPFETKKPLVGPDGGVLVGPDGGPVFADAGPAGSPSTTVDAGPSAPVAPKSAPKLSARTPGGQPVRSFVVNALTATGDPLLLVGTLAFGGTLAWRVVDLGAHAKLGTVTAAHVAEDGGVVAVLGGTHVVTARPNKTSADVAKAISRGGKLGKLEVQSVHDVVIAPGGDVLAVVDVMDTSAPNAPVLPAVVVQPSAKGASAAVVKKHGDTVPDAAEQSIAISWHLSSRRGDGRITVAETFREGTDEVAPKRSGEEFTLNPSRLLVGRVDQLKALVDVARTDVEPSGLADRTLQSFGDAVFLPDGRAVFDANFVEEGPGGALFTWRAGGAGVQAVAGAFPVRAPRTKQLDVEPDGALAFVWDEAVALSSLKAPKEIVRGVKGAIAVAGSAPEQKPLGVITRVDALALAKGGDLVVAAVAVAGVGDAIVVASLADVRAGVADAVLTTGAPVPVAAPAEKMFGKTVKNLRVIVDEDPLWAPAPALSPSAPAPPAPPARVDAGVARDAGVK